MRSTAFFFLALCVSATSCADYAARVENYGVSSVQFADIPVPDGMNLDVRKYKSHSYEIGAFRHGDFEYYGNVDTTDAAAYMRERMDVHGWSLLDDGLVDEATTLRFGRKPYETACRIWQDDGLTQMRVEVRTTVSDR